MEAFVILSCKELEIFKGAKRVTETDNITLDFTVEDWNKTHFQNVIGPIRKVDAKAPTDPAVLVNRGQLARSYEVQILEIIQGIARQQGMAKQTNTLNEIAHVISLFKIRPFAREYFQQLFYKKIAQLNVDIDLNHVIFIHTSPTTMG